MDRSDKEQTHPPGRSPAQGVFSKPQLHPHGASHLAIGDASDRLPELSRALAKKVPV